MKRQRHSLSFMILSFIIIVAGCGNPSGDSEKPSGESAMESSETPMDTAAVIAEIDEVRNAFTAMVESGNYEAMQSIAHPDFMAVGPFGQEWDSLRSMGVDGQYPDGTVMVITPAEFRITGEGWAYEFGNTETTFTPDGSEIPIVLRDTYLMLFRNEGDGWKLYKEVATSTSNR